MGAVGNAIHGAELHGQGYCSVHWGDPYWSDGGLDQEELAPRLLGQWLCFTFTSLALGSNVNQRAVTKYHFLIDVLYIDSLETKSSIGCGGCGHNTIPSYCFLHLSSTWFFSSQGQTPWYVSTHHIPPTADQFTEPSSLTYSASFPLIMKNVILQPCLYSTAMWVAVTFKRAFKRAQRSY